MSQNSPQKILQKFLSEKKLVRILFILVIILALVAGYYQSLYANEVKKNWRIKDSYVRMSGQLNKSY